MTVCRIARGTAQDIKLALDAAHAAREAWGKTSPADRSVILNKIADRMSSASPRWLFSNAHCARQSANRGISRSDCFGCGGGSPSPA